MKVEDEVSSVADLNATLPLHPRELEGLQLLEEGGEVNDYAVTDDACRHLVEDARGDEVELVLPAVGYDGVACVGASGDAGADVIGLGEDVDELALSLVAPLGAEDDVDAVRGGS